MRKDEDGDADEEEEDGETSWCDDYKNAENNNNTQTYTNCSNQQIISEPPFCGAQGLWLMHSHSNRLSLELPMLGDFVGFEDSKSQISSVEAKYIEVCPECNCAGYDICFRW